MRRALKVSPWREPGGREAKRDAVLRTAAQMFSERGFHATSLDEVAERLNVTKPTLYYYVKNKEEILFECVRIGIEMLHDAIDAASRSGGSARDKLTAAMHQYAEIVTMDFGKCVVHVGEDPLPPESQKRLRRLKATIDREFRSLIEQGIAEGSIAPCDPKIAAFTLAGALSWIGRWYRADGPLPPEEISRQIIALLMKGLTAPDVVAPKTRKAARRKDYEFIDPKIPAS